MTGTRRCRKLPQPAREVSEAPILSFPQQEKFGNNSLSREEGGERSTLVGSLKGLDKRNDQILDNLLLSRDDRKSSSSFQIGRMFLVDLVLEEIRDRRRSSRTSEPPHQA